MNKKNEQLYEEAKKAIMELYGDTSVSRDEARDNLRGLCDEIDMLISTLE